MHRSLKTLIGSALIALFTLTTATAQLKSLEGLPRRTAMQKPSPNSGDGEYRPSGEGLAQTTAWLMLQEMRIPHRSDPSKTHYLLSVGQRTILVEKIGSGVSGLKVEGSVYPYYMRGDSKKYFAVSVRPGLFSRSSKKVEFQSSTDFWASTAQLGKWSCERTLPDGSVTKFTQSHPAGKIPGAKDRATPRDYQSQPWRKSTNREVEIQDSEKTNPGSRSGDHEQIPTPTPKKKKENGQLNPVEKLAGVLSLRSRNRTKRK